MEGNVFCGRIFNGDSNLLYKRDCLFLISEVYLSLLIEVKLVRVEFVLWVIMVEGCLLNEGMIVEIVLKYVDLNVECR